jgi:hypothetical protein
VTAIRLRILLFHHVCDVVVVASRWGISGRVLRFVVSYSTGSIVDPFPSGSQIK